MQYEYLRHLIQMIIECENLQFNLIPSLKFTVYKVLDIKYFWVNRLIGMKKLTRKKDKY